MGVGIGTCCCECETSKNYVYVRPDVPINLQIIRFTAQVKEPAGSAVLLCTYGDFETNATFIYQSTADGVHTFRQFNRWTGYDPGGRPPLNASITDMTLGISTSYETIAGVTWLKKARIEWIEFRRIYGVDSSTDYTWRLELNDTGSKLVKVSGSCGCIKRVSSPLVADLANRWVYPPDNFTQLRVFTNALGFDPVGSKSFDMSISGFTAPWDVFNFSGATLSYVSGGVDFEDGFTFGFRHDGAQSGTSIIFQTSFVPETDDRDLVNTSDLVVAMARITLTRGSATVSLAPSNLATTAKQPDVGDDWDELEWRYAIPGGYGGLAGPPDLSAVVVTITETP